jgi:hypothetical protein
MAGCRPTCPQQRLVVESGMGGTPYPQHAAGMSSKASECQALVFTHKNTQSHHEHMFCVGRQHEDVFVSDGGICNPPLQDAMH